jgi:tetratricopeptide (TPR) repeat protein
MATDNATSDFRRRFDAALDLHRQGLTGRCLLALEDLLRQRPDDLSLRYCFGAIAVQAGDPVAALPHLEAVVAAHRQHIDAAEALARAYVDTEQAARAVQLWRRYLAHSPGLRAHVRLLEALLADGQQDHARREAESLEQHIPGAAPRLAIGTVFHEAGHVEEAVGWYRRALQADPEERHAREHLAAAEYALGRIDEARVLYERLARDFPGDAAIWQALGSLYKEQDDLAGGMSCYQRAMHIKRRMPETDELPLLARDPAQRRTSVHSLTLELEQLEALREAKVKVRGLDSLIDGYREVLDDLRIGPPGEHKRTLTEAQFMLIGRAMHRLVHHEPAERLAGGALNPDVDWAAVETDYQAARPGLVVVDGFLREQAIEALRGYALRSTIWFDYSKAGGYCGSYLNDGFGCPLLMQLAEELRERMPAVLGPHPLTHLWGYIYDATLSGITSHADPAKVNLNFWVTPDDANLDPDSGGLVVWTREAPADWDFQAYNNEPEAIDAFVADSDKVVVPHRRNRVVMFNSSLVHRTDDFRFRPGLMNRRLNMTMLFGHRGRPEAGGTPQPE